MLTKRSSNSKVYNLYDFKLNVGHNIQFKNFCLEIYKHGQYVRCLYLRNGMQACVC